MRILCYGSLNIDLVYKVKDFVSPGETIMSIDHNVFSGGKGLNQAIAASKAGAHVYFGGAIGTDGGKLIEELKKANVNTDHIKITEAVTGHAVIQVNATGQNSIIVYGGANSSNSKKDINNALAFFDENDILLIQNEINNVPSLIEGAKRKKMRIIFNPSPITEELDKYPIELVDTLILNEVEGESLSDEMRSKEMLERLREKYPQTALILTLGRNGSIYKDGEKEKSFGIYESSVVDTTAAGDTFCGYYTAGVSIGMSFDAAIHYATAAAAIAVSRKGAASSIPNKSEVAALMVRSKMT